MPGARLDGVESYFTRLPDRAKAAPGDHDVIQDADIQQLSGFDQFFRKTQVFLAWLRITRWVVVNQDHRGCAFAQRQLEYFRQPHRGVVDGADIKLLFLDQSVARVQYQNP